MAQRSSKRAPKPLLPPEFDCRDLDGFMLNVERLLKSELVAIASPAECWHALMLWCHAWKQVPAASLPNDERVLAAWSGARDTWPQVREHALHGFVLCSDGRLYHPVLAEDAERAFLLKQKYTHDRQTDRDRLARWRKAKVEQREGNGSETAVKPVSDGVRNGHETPGKRLIQDRDGTGTLKEEDSDSASAESAAASAAPRSPVDPIKALFDKGVALLCAARVPEKQARSVIGKWNGEYGVAAVMAAIVAAEDEPTVMDPIAFIVRCLNNSKRGRAANGHDQKQSAGEKLFEGGYRAALAWEERERTRRETDEPLLDIGRPDSDAPGSDRGLD